MFAATKILPDESEAIFWDEKPALAHWRCLMCPTQLYHHTATLLLYVLASVSPSWFFFFNTCSIHDPSMTLRVRFTLYNKCSACFITDGILRRTTWLLWKGESQWRPGVWLQYIGQNILPPPCWQMWHVTNYKVTQKVFLFTSFCMFKCSSKFGLN